MGAVSKRERIHRVDSVEGLAKTPHPCYTFINLKERNTMETTKNMQECEPVKDYWLDGKHYDTRCGNCYGSLGENGIHAAWNYCPYCGEKIKK